ncbi:serine hydrolase domain-containing protein [candidate division KSB1 bacterium]
MKNRLFSGIFIIGLLSVFVFLSASFDRVEESRVQVKSEKFSEVREKIISAVNRGRIPSMAVAVSKGGIIIWEEGFGWADLQKQIKATAHTMYSLASISKPITATGLMILLERGLVKLDDPVNKLISPAALRAFEGKAEDATVKHLLNHTSGLPLHYTFFYEDEPYSKPPMPESISRYGILVHPPGEIYQYANFGFGIIDFIISRVSKENYTDFMKKEVFLPLGMTHTSIDIGPGLEQYAAVRYDNDKDPIPFYTFDHPGASAVFSSAHDLVRFGMFHLKDKLPGQKQILKDETLDLMHYEGDISSAEGGYKLGWGFNKDNYGYPSLSHGGGMPGVSTSLKIFPTEDIAIVVLNNIGSPLGGAISDDIAGILLPEFSENKRKARRKPMNIPKPYSPTEELIGQWEGKIVTYQGEVPVEINFQEDGDINIKLNKSLKTILNGINFELNWFTGQFEGTIPTDDARMYEHNIFLRMKLKDKKLSGYATAQTTTKRLYWGLSSYISLTKEEE